MEMSHRRLIGFVIDGPQGQGRFSIPGKSLLFLLWHYISSIALLHLSGQDWCATGNSHLYFQRVFVSRGHYWQFFFRPFAPLFRNVFGCCDILALSLAYSFPYFFLFFDAAFLYKTLSYLSEPLLKTLCKTAVHP